MVVLPQPPSVLFLVVSIASPADALLHPSRLRTTNGQPSGTIVVTTSTHAEGPPPFP